jgi:hypothetical protein
VLVWINGSAATRPPSARTVFVDGRAGAEFRPEVDVELSHHFGNRTPRQFRGDTSTAICMRFVEAKGHADLAVNDHLDVDGVLALFALLVPEVALGHRRTLMQAAEMADFFCWGEPPAQELYQGLSLFLAEARGDPSLIAVRAVEKTRSLLAPGARPELAAGLKVLQRGARMIDNGDVRRRTWGARFVHYEIPFDLGTPAALRVPSLGEPISDACLLWPQARARLDRERIALVTVGMKGGWAHELWYPGYCWAEAPQSWRPPGVEEDGSFAHPGLAAALLRLQALETGEGAWVRAQRVRPDCSMGGRGFPVVAAFLKDGQPAGSTIKPDQVAQILSGAF